MSEERSFSEQFGFPEPSSPRDKSYLVMALSAMMHGMGNSLNSVVIHLQLLERRLRKSGIKDQGKFEEYLVTATSEVNKIDSFFNRLNEWLKRHSGAIDFSMMLSPKEKLESMGYAVIELPDKLKSVFHEALRGFEDFAVLQGFSVAVSLDSSIEGMFAFKLTTSQIGTLEEAKRECNPLSLLADYLNAVRVEFGGEPDGNEREGRLSGKILSRLGQHTRSSELMQLLASPSLRSDRLAQLSMPPQTVVNQYLIQGGATPALVNQSIVGSANSQMTGGEYGITTEQLQTIKSLIASMMNALPKADPNLCTKEHRRLVDDINDLNEEISSGAPSKGRIGRIFSRIGESLPNVKLGADIVKTIQEILAAF